MKRPLCLLVVPLLAAACLTIRASGSPQGSATSRSKGAKAGERQAVSATSVSSASTAATVTIPGPLRSFLRMAAVSQKVSPDEVLPYVARNVSKQGYQGGKPTEFLVLLRRYFDQARELTVLAGPDAVLKVSTCDEAKPLLAILGYRMREACGPKTAVETSDPDRAFLTIDSGFPLAELEETLRGGKPFNYSYRSTPVPVFLAPHDWVVDEKVEREERKRNGGEDALESILRDPTMARLYWALSRIDPATVAELRRSPGLANLIPVTAALDFYGTQISIREGRVVVPGGKQAESAWKELAGASPENPGEFVSRLLAKDEGWLASYFDVLSRLSRSQQAYFTEPKRLSHFYEALRGNDISPSPARPVFRPEPGLLLLTTLLEIEPTGQPHVPGGVDVWKDVVASHRKDNSKITKEWAKRAGHWNDPEQVVEGMIGLSRENEAANPLQVFLAISEIDAGRAGGERLTPQTVKLLTDRFPRFGDQYAIFSEFSGLNNASITRYMSAAEAINKISDHSVRGNAMGIFQANVGLWEILARQGEISAGKWNDSWQKMIAPLAAVHSSLELFEAGRTSWNELIRAAADRSDLSQDEAIALLAGPNQSSAEAQQVRQDLASRMRTVMDDQRLLSLDTIFGLADGLTVMSQGPAPDTLLAQAQQIREFQMPRPFFTTTERNEWAAGFYNTSHATLQMRTDFTKIIKSPGSPEELADARGQLAPFLRDTLVGLNYAYYEPPAAQAMHNNPLLVRSHDFSGEMTPGADEAWRVPRVFGRGWTASGGAHLTGSLADLPYVLAQLEQDFTVPENVQALIWDELVPGLVSGAVTSRWWGVTRNELHAAALYQETGEQILLAAAKNQKVRENAMNILADRMLIDRAARVNERLASGHAEELILETSPAEKFYLAAEYRRNYPSDFASVGPAAKELDALIVSYPDEGNLARLSRDFGAPHPILKQSYGSELLNLKPFPSFMGYPSRLLAETWDSDNLYWARLADERGYAPETLNNVVPLLTHRMVEKIFATDFEDWRAVLRALHETGAEFQKGEIASLQGPVTSPRQ